MRVGRVRLWGIRALVCLLVPAGSWAAEGRVPVYAPGTVISSPGKYIVTRNLDGDGIAPVIEIGASNVELDLNGFVLSNQGSGVGIRVDDPTNEVLIRNGDISSVSVGVDVDSLSGGAERAVIEDVRVYVPLTAGIRVAKINNVVVRRVLVYRSSGEGIRVNGSLSTSGEIVDSQVNQPGEAGISVSSAASFSILDNRVRGSGLEGIRLDACVACRVEGNTVRSGGGLAGISVTSMRGGSLGRNHVFQATASGIRIGTGSEDLLVQGNTSSNNGEDGLRAEGLRLYVEGNALNQNTGYGLRFAAGGYSIFGRNMARNNGGAGGASCAETPSLFPPDSCNDGVSNLTLGDNLIPGPALF